MLLLKNSEFAIFSHLFDFVAEREKKNPDCFLGQTLSFGNDLNMQFAFSIHI